MVGGPGRWEPPRLKPGRQGRGRGGEQGAAQRRAGAGGRGACIQGPQAPQVRLQGSLRRTWGEKLAPGFAGTGCEEGEELPAQRTPPETGGRRRGPGFSVPTGVWLGRILEAKPQVGSRYRSQVRRRPRKPTTGAGRQPWRRRSGRTDLGWPMHGHAPFPAVGAPGVSSLRPRKARLVLHRLHIRRLHRCKVESRHQGVACTRLHGDGQHQTDLARVQTLERSDRRIPTWTPHSLSRSMRWGVQRAAALAPIQACIARPLANSCLPQTSRAGAPVLPRRRRGGAVAGACGGGAAPARQERARG